MRALLLILLPVAILISGNAHADSLEPSLVDRHRGVVFAAVEPPADYSPDIPLLPSADAIARLKRGLDRLESGAPGLSTAIDRLRKAGDVVIVYYPVFPARQTAAITAAAFYPQFFNPASAEDTFLVFFGRYGINWSIDDIALVLAHELAGHGIQHLEKRLPAPETIDTDPYARRIDFECEANLYTELALQQLHIDPQAGPHARHRRALEQRWCKPFIDWLSRNDPVLAEEWQHKNPDVSKLLPALHRFIEAVAEHGIHQAYRPETLEQARQAAASLRETSGSSLYLQGRQALTDGDIETAIAFLELSAEKRFNRANLLLAEIMLTHAPGGPYIDQARAYLETAQAQGSVRAAERLDALGDRNTVD